MRARAAIEAAMNEGDLQDWILQIAKKLKWEAYHTFDSRRSHEGWPDLVLLRGSRLIFAELKTEKGKVSPAQRWWLDGLAAAGEETYVWRPSDQALIEKLLL